MSDSRYVDSKAIARMLGVDRETVYRYAQQELIPYYRIGGRIRFIRQEVVDALAESRKPPLQEKAA